MQSSSSAHKIPSLASAINKQEFMLAVTEKRRKLNAKIESMRDKLEDEIAKHQSSDEIVAAEHMKRREELKSVIKLKQSGLETKVVGVGRFTCM